MSSPILAPAAVLIAWSMIMWGWLLITRIGSFKSAGVDLKTAKKGARGSDLEAILPPEVMWKAHNYNHLMEQPTLFYAVVMILALSGFGDGLNAQLAWAYAGLRIAHSVWQATINTVPIRFLLFMLSSICLIALSVHAVMATL
ncbi:MAG: MAPEG family protein [Halieaceae bacterium]|nr:MAPEG family protein [Halieaceae bacterium]